VVRLIKVAEMANETVPGCRTEILWGQLLVRPHEDGSHQAVLTDLAFVLCDAGLHRGGTRVIQGPGLWLPTGEEDHAVPDLAVVVADHRDHDVAYNCLAPVAFRLIVEVTSETWWDDLHRKPRAYAAAEVPVYVIGDREHDEVIVLTEPKNGEYRSRTVYRPGEPFSLPESIGAKVEVEAAAFLTK
jgi:Uma2 family endonuclease